jgi:DNA-binding response OmpR family regulator
MQTQHSNPTVAPLRAPRSPAVPNLGEFALDARVETTQASSERLLAAMRDGVRDYVLTSTNGRVSARIRLTLASLSVTEHDAGGQRVLVDWSRCTIAHQQARTTISQSELRLLATLLAQPGSPVARAVLIRHVWPDDARPMLEREKTLAVYICSLRKRLTMIGVGSCLRTIRCVGYQLDP